jgi:hypothetical protein
MLPHTTWRRTTTTSMVGHERTEGRESMKRSLMTSTMEESTTLLHTRCKDERRQPATAGTGRLGRGGLTVSRGTTERLRRSSSKLNWEEAAQGLTTAGQGGSGLARPWLRVSWATARDLGERGHGRDAEGARHG